MITSPVRSLAALGIAAAALSALALACQSYEFDQVQPKAVVVANPKIPVVGTQAPPKVMLVVDKSGSMMEQASGSGGGCYDSFGAYTQTGSCKWNDLKNAFAAPGAFLDQMKDKAVFGLAAFPSVNNLSTGCEIGEILVQPGAGNVVQIINQLKAISPEGGTPSAATLAKIGADPAFKATGSERRFVMLLTDGLPNCNGSLSCSTCQKDPGVSACSDPKNGCVDGDQLVNAVTNLKKAGIDTFVIGFGADTAGGIAGTILSRAAQAGGQARAGTPSYYQAGNAAELQAVLDKIKGNLQTCTWDLQPAPQSPNAVQIVLRTVASGDTQELKKGTDWTFASESACFPTSGTARSCVVQASAELCGKLQSAQPNTYELDFSYASSF